jgi:hypothetical protein
VYEYAVENVRESNQCRSIAQRTMRHYEVPINSALDYRGLTQVCQEIRKEFRLLYLAAKVVGVSINHVLDYLRTYYPAINAGSGVTKPIQGEIIIIVVDMREKLLRTPSRIRHADFVKPVPKAYDLFPMLKHCLITLNLKISFVADIASKSGGLNSYNASCARNFNVWFRAHKDNWKIAISRDLCKINFRYHSMSSMELVFKTNSAQDWVAEVMEDARIQSDGREAYYSALGFRDRGHMAYPTVLQE